MKAPRCLRYALAALLLLVTLAACAPDDEVAVGALLDEWAEEKKVVPKKDEEGKTDVAEYVSVAVTDAKLAINGSTGNQDAGAAVGIGDLIDQFVDNDEATDEGVDTRDPKKIEGAIAARPDDYHYRNALAVTLLANGDVTGSDAAFRDAGAAWRRSNPKGSESDGNQVNTRDALGCLDRAIKAADQNGTSSENWHALRAKYCDEAIKYYNQTRSEHYLKNARDKLGIDCSKY